jgi:hypothetical protein
MELFADVLLCVSSRWGKAEGSWHGNQRFEHGRALDEDFWNDWWRFGIDERSMTSQLSSVRGLQRSWQKLAFGQFFLVA